MREEKNVTWNRYIGFDLRTRYFLKLSLLSECRDIKAEWAIKKYFRAIIKMSIPLKQSLENGAKLAIKRILKLSSKALK